MPNLAIIDEVKNHAQEIKKEVEVLYICSRSNLDISILKRTNISYKTIFTWKIRRYFDLQNILEFFLFWIGLLQSFFIILKFRPTVVFCKGGFVSVPVALAAFLLRRKIITHESDTIPGLANRIIAKFSYQICTGFPIQGKKYVFTGNPLRKGVLDGVGATGYAFTGFDSSRKTILIMGGSQGALKINQLIEKILPDLVEKYQVIHITGETDEENVEKKYNKVNIKNFVKKFSGNMGSLYKIADVAITRAGALTVSELAAAGLPAILIPFPYATDDHQKENAKMMENSGCAKVIFEDTLTEEMISEMVEEIISNKNIKTET